MISQHLILRFGKWVLAVTDRRRLDRLALCLIVSAGMSGAHAAPGDFDTSFANGGVASFPMPSVSGVAHDLALFPDGSLLIGGTVGISPLLLKLSPTGIVDTTFGTNGSDSVRRGNQPVQEGMVVAAAPPNQFTVVEFHGDQFACHVPVFFAYCAFRDLVARRINGSGTPDPSYGMNGLTIVPRSEGSLAVSPAGEVVALTMRPQQDIAFAPVLGVVALRPDGLEDAEWEQRALAALNCGSQFAAGSNPVGATRWTGGKLLVAMGVGTSLAPSAPHTLCVSRLNDDGSLDTSFATNGHLIYQTASLASHFPFKILVRGDGRILIVLLNDKPSFINNPAFVWLTPNGGLDTAFVSGGLTFPAPVLVASVVDISLQPDDKILVVGYNSLTPGTPTLPLDLMHPILARVEANGSTFDATFGTAQSGYRTLTVGMGWLSPQKVVAGGGSDIFVLGTLFSSNTPPISQDFAIAKLRGVPDSGNGGGGGGGGCAMVQGVGGGPIDPTFPLLLVLALAWGVPSLGRAFDRCRLSVRHAHGI